MSPRETAVRLRFLTVLCCGTALYFFANIQRVAVPGAVFDRLQRLYGCQAAGVAGLGAAFMFAYTVWYAFVSPFFFRRFLAHLPPVGQDAPKGPEP